jgi:hypothetical protein
MEKNSNKALSLTVTEGLTVAVLPNSDHEFLMTTKEVASGYGTTKYAIQQAFHRNSSELIEGKHYATALTICQHDPKIPHNSILWTKRGVVRLGFFIKSERAKLFRDWAEDLVIKLADQVQQGTLFDTPARQLPAKRHHNRLTPDRMVSIMADVCRVENSELRLSLVDKLTGGQAQW